MTGLRREEEWARQLIAAALSDVTVSQHDDGQRPGMHDLNIVRDGRRFAAVEVTTAADGDSMALWKLVNPRDSDRWIVPTLSGGWTVGLRPEARARRILRELPELLARLERSHIEELDADSWSSGAFESEAFGLGITHARHGDSVHPGAIYLMVEQAAELRGGFVADTGDELPRWLSEWIREPEQADNLQKLGRSGADERHLFVAFPPFSIAPFGVIELLTRSEPPLPTIPPSLPDGLTHLWAVSAWTNGRGMRWAPEGWRLFDHLR